MPLTNILVHLDNARPCGARLEAAIALAQKHQAQLTGLYVYSLPRQEQAEQKAENSRRSFLQQTSEAGIAAEWIGADLAFSRSGIAEIVSLHACFTDLVVIGQPHPDTQDPSLPPATAERLLLGSGPPVLIVPQGWRPGPVGERVMVAWKAGPKSTRAMNDSLPLLKTAAHVTLTSIGASSFFKKEVARLTGHLARHGVAAKFEQVPAGDLSTGDTLLALLADDGIDLLVMGVHVQVRRGVLDMGEVGKHLLKNMPVPILMSH